MPNTYYAVIYAAMGNKEAMYENLDRALNVREREIHDMNLYPWFDSYKAEDRFQGIINAMWVPL